MVANIFLLSSRASGGSNASPIIMNTSARPWTPDPDRAVLQVAVPGRLEWVVVFVDDPVQVPSHDTRHSSHLVEITDV
jgi:hypothetical protein